MERKQVSWLRVAKRVGLFWALFALVIGLIFTTVGGGMAWKAMTLARDGVAVTGEVLETQIRISHASDGATRRSYHVTYRFIPEGEGHPADPRRRCFATSLLDAKDRRVSRGHPCAV